MREVVLPGGEQVAALGQGTWRTGERPDHHAAEIEALRTGVELGITLIDTAEMYGDGATESLVGEALAGLREDVFLVSKAYPQNAGRGRLERACEASLKRLRTDRLDLYLLHWRGSIPLAETVEGMEALRGAGKIAAWGVSNLDLDDMDELAAAGGEGCATDQVLYSVSRRGPEFDLLPALADRGVSVMAYSPVEQGRLSTGGALKAVAERHGATPYQVTLAWVMRISGVFAIPKAADVATCARSARRPTCSSPLRTSPPSTPSSRRPRAGHGWRCSEGIRSGQSSPSGATLGAPSPESVTPKRRTLRGSGNSACSSRRA